MPQYTLSIHECPPEKIQEIVTAAECKGPCTCTPAPETPTVVIEEPKPEEKPADAPAEPTPEPASAPAAVPEPSTV